VATLQKSSRIKTVTDELAKHGLTDFEFNIQSPPLVRTIETVTLSCSDNHQQIYRKALAKNYSYICVLEDDVYFTGQVPNISEIKNFLHSKNWDFLFFGHFPWSIRKYNLHSKNRIEFNSIFRSISWCTHGYAISNTGIKKMLKWSPKEMMTIARQGMPISLKLLFMEQGGIDSFIAYKTAIHEFQSFCVYPMFIFQHSIPNWKIMAQIAEYFSYWLDYWPNKVGCLLFIIIWITLMTIGYSNQKYL
jgi:GR25 family glycosyltransferase involved in LPS biosynthesis